MEKLLVISLAGIGDTLQATPFLRELRLRYPAARIDVAVLWAGSAQLLHGNPNIDDVHQFNLIEGSRPAGLHFLLGLRRRHYDVSFTLHPQGRREYRIVTRLIGARRRLSHRYENQSWVDRWLVTDSLDQDYAVSGPENNLRLLSLLGHNSRLAPNPALELHLSPGEHSWADGWLHHEGLSTRPWIGIHVGSGGTKNLALRRWPVARWIEFLRLLAQHAPELAVVAFGGPGEAGAHREIQSAVPGDNFHVAQTPGLREAAALVARAHRFVSVDTAFMHIAAATRVPRQWVIQTPTLNPPVHPFRPDWCLIPNPAVGNHALDFYRYDGRPIRGTPDELRRIMDCVPAQAVAEAVLSDPR